MSKFTKTVFYTAGFIFVLTVLLCLCGVYASKYRTETVDKAFSPNGKYTLILQSVGEPDWPFGSARGQLVLKNSSRTLSKTKFEIKNDGANITASCWKVAWQEEYVQVTVSGSEQADEKILINLK